MTPKEERIINLEIHRMNRTQNEVIARNAALEAECARLRMALQHESERHAAIFSAMTINAKIEIAQQLEHEKTKLAQSMREQNELIVRTDFEEYVKTHTAKMLKTIALSEISYSIAANYAHTQLIYNLDFKGKRILIFSHYSKDNEVQSYNYLTLEKLDERFDFIIILTNCPNKWELNHPNHNKYHILSYNFKNDFRNYYVFIMQTEKTLIRASQVCLMNDSFVVVDVGAFGRCMKHLFESTKADFVGITSSHEGVYHLQSYFIVFNGQAVNAIVNYFKMRGLPINYQAAISEYELGITAHLSKDGLVPVAMVSNQEMPVPLNTTHCKWSVVLQYTGIVKRQHFLKKYPPRFAMTDLNIALIADKFCQNVHFIHFLKHNGIKLD